MKRMLIVSLAVLAASCGFQPLYGQGAAIGAVDVARIDGKAGHVLKTELDRMLSAERGAGAPMRLDIALSEEVNRLGIRLDESATRAELRLNARYTLTPADGGEPLRGLVTQAVNYEIPTAAFGEISAQDDARERAAESLAQRLRTELALRLAHERKPRT